MTTIPLFAAMIGGWELLLILAVLVTLAVCLAFALGLVFYFLRRQQKQAANPPAAATPPRI